MSAVPEDEAVSFPLTPLSEKALAGIDWHGGWFDGWREQGQLVQAQILSGATVAQALNAHGCAPVSYSDPWDTGRSKCCVFKDNRRSASCFGFFYIAVPIRLRTAQCEKQGTR